MNGLEIIIAEDQAEHTALAAEVLARAIQTAVDDRGRARIALSGGSTPSKTYERLAELRLPWEHTEWFWVDERAVPAESDRSNFGQALSCLRLRENGVPEAQIHRMEAEAADREAAARRYERALRESFGVASAAAFDAMTMGIGGDGHTASLFPGLEVPLEGEPRHPVDIQDRLVAAVASPGDLEARLTLTTPVILETRLILVLCRGEAKREVIKSAQALGDEHEVPARLFLRARGRVVWLLDRDAASSD